MAGLVPAILLPVAEQRSRFDEAVTLVERPLSTPGLGAIILHQDGHINWR